MVDMPAGLRSLGRMVAVTTMLALLPTPFVAAAPTCFGLPATIVGTDDDDHLRGEHHQVDVIVGLGGEDSIDGGRRDIVCGNAGRDYLSGGHMDGGRGPDVISTGGGRNIGRGGPGRDEMSLSHFRGDEVDGGPGVNVVTVVIPLRVPRPSLEIDIAGGYVEATIGRASISNVQDARACVDSRVPVVIGGDEGPNRFEISCGAELIAYGRGGDDALIGNFGADHLVGGEGNDVLASRGAGDEAREILRGGPGIDTASFRIPFERRASIEASLRTGLALITFPETVIGGLTRLKGIESLRGGRGRDTLEGDEHANSLLGGRGGDELDGRGGFDELKAGGGADVCRNGRVDSDCDATSPWIFPFMWPGHPPATRPPLE